MCDKNLCRVKYVTFIYLIMPDSNVYKRATARLNGRLIIPYQRDGVMWMLDREMTNGLLGGMLCDEMGLGKTIQIITTIIGNPKPKTLIIVPKSIVHQWKSEINRFAPNLKVTTFEGSNRATDVSAFDDYDVVIAPYTVMTNRKSDDDTILHDINWNRIILDEGHEIRNKKSKTHISILKLSSEIRWIITGTPVFNSMKDFISLCAFFGIKQNEVQGKSNEIREKYVIRRTISDVSKFNTRIKLPPVTFENVELDLSPEESILYGEVYNESQESTKDMHIGKSAYNMHILECLLRCRQVMAHPQCYLNGIAKKNDEPPDVWEFQTSKNIALLRFIQGHPDEKSLVFCQFVSEMDEIHEMLVNKNIQVYRIDGSVSSEDRTKQISQFTESSSNSVFIIQIKAGGVGLNLQSASRVYITSPSWNPATELQAIGRSHRTGQTRLVHVKKLVYNDMPDLPSVDHSIMSLQGHKSTICADVLNDPRLLTQLPTKKTMICSIKAIQDFFRSK